MQSITAMLSYMPDHEHKQSKLRTKDHHSMSSQMTRLAPLIKYSHSFMRRLGGLDVLILCVWPWLLTIINRNWAFLNTWSFTDTWIYFGYFNNLQQLQHIYQDFDKVYFGDRLTWVLPGYILHQLLPPIIANFILHLGVYYISVLSVYHILISTIGRRGAFIAALLLGNYSYFILSAGTDYVEGAGIAYFLLTILLLTKAQQKRQQNSYLFASGVATAAIIYTNLFWVVFVPYLAAYYLFLNWQNWRRRIVFDSSLLLSGFLGLTLVLSIANQIISGNFFFYAHSLSFASNLFKSSTNTYISYPTNWFLYSPHLIWPFITAVGCLIALAIPRARKKYAPV